MKLDILFTLGTLILYQDLFGITYFNIAYVFIQKVKRDLPANGPGGNIALILVH